MCVLQVGGGRYLSTVVDMRKGLQCRAFSALHCQEYVFRKILDADVAADHLSKTKADAIYTTALSSPVSLTKKKGDMRLVNAALMRHKALVDKADEERLDEVMAQVELALTAAEANPNGPGELNRESPNLEFIAELAMWSNRGRGLKETSEYIQNMQDISRVAWEEEYLSIQRQFTKKVEPEDFSKWQKKSTEPSRTPKTVPVHCWSPSQLPIPHQNRQAPCTPTGARTAAVALLPISLKATASPCASSTVRRSTYTTPAGQALPPCMKTKRWAKLARVFTSFAGWPAPPLPTRISTATAPQCECRGTSDPLHPTRKSKSQP